MAVFDSVLLFPKDDLETCLYKFGPPWKGLLPRFVGPQKYNLDENMQGIAPMTYFTRTKCHWPTWRCLVGASLEPRAFGLRSEGQATADAEQLQDKQIKTILRDKSKLGNSIIRMFVQITDSIRTILYLYGSKK